MLNYALSQLGGIEEILAPTGGPQQKFFLAIQFLRNEEVQNTIYSGALDINKASDNNGAKAIHIACKYNNRFCVELLLSREIHIEALDSYGNNPLHFAAKHGHIDLCKFLIEKGCSVLKRNNYQQTPYDVAQSHVVRQYLLPIQLKAESEQVSSQDMYNQNQPFLLNTQSSFNHPPAPTFNPPVPTFTNEPLKIPLMPSYNAPPKFDVTNEPVINPGLQANQPDFSAIKPNNLTNVSSRVIRPDGFHTSASDPALQQKYGHVKQLGLVQQNGHVVTGPPPIVPLDPSLIANNNSNSNSNSSNNNNLLASNQQNVFSRYVSVDFNSNQPTSIPLPFSQAPIISNATSVLPPQSVGVNIFSPQSNLATGTITNPALLQAMAPAPAPAPAPVVTNISRNLTGRVEVNKNNIGKPTDS